MSSAAPGASIGDARQSRPGTVREPRGPRVWLLAARPATLPAAVVPVLVGSAAALHDTRALEARIFVAALGAAVLIQIGTNFANDVFDFQKGADTAERLGPLRVTQGGLVTIKQMLTATYCVFGLALLIGLYLVTIGGWPILILGLLCILAGLAYTGGPWPFGYHGLGDLVCFIFFGPAAVLGTAYLYRHEITLVAAAASIPVGCLVTAILVVNNLRDLAVDREVGKRTLAVMLGRTATCLEYLLWITLAMVVVVALGVSGLVGMWWWLPLLSMPLAIWLVRYIYRTTGRPLNLALKRTGQLHLLFGVLLAAALWLG